MADLGSYVLFVECGSPIAVDVGALGEREFLPGTYAYVGSAFGPGGLSRVERHRRVAVGDHNVRHWHIDYLLGAHGTHLSEVEPFPDRDVECALATAFADAGCQPVDSFGASDCDCVSHLWRVDNDVQRTTAIRSVASDSDRLHSE